MNETFTRDDVDFGYSKVPNGLWTADLSHGAKCLLGWLWSHDHDYLARLSVRRIGVEFGGGGQVVEWLRDLAAKGYVTKSKQGTQYRVHVEGDAWKALTVRKPNATASNRSETERYRDGYRTVTATETEHREDKGEDQGEDQPLAPASPVRGRKRNLVYDALAEACEIDPREMTPSEARACGVAAAELAKVDATAEEIHRRAGVYHQKFPQAALTPNALKKNWAALRVAPMMNGRPGLAARTKAKAVAASAVNTIEGTAR